MNTTYTALSGARIFFHRHIVSVAKWLLAVVMFMTGAGQSALAATGPCDIYASGGTACVAAHSTTRALFGAYSGRLYQVKRASDGAVTDVGTLAAGGYANAATQDSFCAGTSCTITIIYDQTTKHNDLKVSGAGGAGPADVPAVANALPIVAGGKLVYGVYVSAGVGYRNTTAVGTARNGQPEGAYMVASGTHLDDGCCFDYGNTEQPAANDIGNGNMDAVYLGFRCEHAPCNGSGPWIAADLENGLFQGNGSNTANTPVPYNFVTAMLKNNGQTTFALKTANSQSGGLTTQYNGTLPNGQYSGYMPMKQQGGIVLGVGGDNSRWSTGSFFEGAMTYGYPSDATENSVQANIAAVGYSGSSNGGAPGTITGPATKCVDVAGGDTGTNGTAVQLWDCEGYSVDQKWSFNTDGTLRSLGRCLDIVGNSTANDTLVQLYDCNSSVGGQKWVQQLDGSLKNPQSGRCLDLPNGIATNGSQLRIHDCNGAAAQKFQYHWPMAGSKIAAPGGKCVDVASDDFGTNGTPVQLWDCQLNAVDQHWTYNSTTQALSTLGRCLDIIGNGTANDTKLELWDCNGVGGQHWVQQADGTLKNPQSGRCVDTAAGSTANGTQLQIHDCNAGASQQYKIAGGTTPAPTPAPGTACWAAWNATTAYNGGAQVSYNHVNYTAAFWTQNQNPSTNNGPAGSGQPWVSNGACT